MAGFGLNLEFVFYLQSQCLTESLGFLNPPPSPSPKTLCASIKNENEKINHHIEFNVFLPSFIWTK